MTYVICEPCVDVKDTACVDVCPVDCIYPGDHDGKSFMVIDPDICIDCNACLVTCPITAIVATESDAPEDAKLNAELSPLFKQNPPVTPRPANDPPRNPSNTLG